MSLKKAWLSLVRSEFAKSPLATNVFFGFILTGLEKLVEHEFMCPCDPLWNALFAACFFVVPGILAFLLMTNIQGCQSGKGSKECRKNLLINSGITMVWLTLVFMDGNYFVCAMTNWSGKYESVPQAVPWKWCKPATDSPELLIKSQEWFTLSQGLGWVFIIILTFSYLVYTILVFRRKTENPVQGGDQLSEQVMGEQEQNPDREASVPCLPESHQDTNV